MSEFIDWITTTVSELFNICTLQSQRAICTHACAYEFDMVWIARVHKKQDNTNLKLVAQITALLKYIHTRSQQHHLREYIITMISADANLQAYLYSCYLHRDEPHLQTHNCSVCERICLRDYEIAAYQKHFHTSFDETSVTVDTAIANHNLICIICAEAY